MVDAPNLRLVDETFLADPAEFRPLPSYNWDQRPSTVPVDDDEAASALVLAHGSPDAAARLLRISLVWLNRLVRTSPRLRALVDELNQAVVLRARSVAIDTLFDASADARRLEWASTKILASRLARGDPFAPAPADSAASMTVNQQQREIIFTWRSPVLPAVDVDIDD